ncbi:MAG: DUF3127 domain-containing protein [Bacteroidales bacterium]|nr:DUF3127 domain-containing protein [Bacteroidales bacterium]
MEFTATLTFIRLTDYQEGTSAKGAWKKQGAVFETRDNYPKTIAVSAFNGWADALANCQPNAAYDIKFDISSREWNGKWYTDIQVHGVTAHATVQVPSEQAQPFTRQNTAPARAAYGIDTPQAQLPLDQQPGIEEPDDLPF